MVGYLREQPAFCVRHELAAAWNQPDAERLPLSFLILPPAAAASARCSFRFRGRVPSVAVWCGKGSLPGPLCTTVLRAGARHLARAVARAADERQRHVDRPGL